ncbi:MAG: LPXTG cell wall anchor domain-containing protein [Clostridia bacterium]|nr:LPXTG cell wall anchor domain-containing protein [Clostridia bacterium]
MKKTAKILSVVLAISMVFGVAVALVSSAFAVEAPTFEVKQVSKNGDEIVVNIDLVKGTFNNLDLVFEMNGVKCKYVDEENTGIAAGDATTSSGAILFSNHEAGEGSSNISMIAINGMKTGTVAVVTLLVTDEEYSFSVKATSCGVSDADYNNTEVTPVINGVVESEKVDDNKPETDKPETDKPETDKPEADKPEADKPETDKPEADKPEADKPEADAPEADAPVVNPSTGESVGSAVAAVAVLGISAAAVVALRKKED